jgi:hypothetical protein
MAKSKQIRFSTKADDEGFFASWYTWTKSLDEIEPPYAQDSRKRDTWLRNYIKREPNLEGVLSTVVAIDKNRGWRMVGGKNQVSRYTRILHSMEVAPGVRGWRAGISHISQSFWGSDMGAMIEIGRDGKDGPMRGLYSLDSARCRLTGKMDKPIAYYPASAKVVYLDENDYMRVPSMVSTDEALRGLGYCAVSRCLDLARMMIAVYDHDKEQLGAQAPRGLLLINGISQQQWTKAMESRDADLEAKDLDYFASVAVLASANAGVDAKLVALSNLPVSFNLREWMDMIIFGYALCFGYDPSEFWPVQFGAIGRGTETEIQHEKATGKGRLDCVLSLQEQLQEELPDSVEFLFDQRDEKGDLLHAQVVESWGRAVSSMSQFISVEEARVLLAEQKVIPTSWAPTADSMSTDLEDPDNEPVITVEPATVKPVDAPATSADATKAQSRTRDVLMSMPSIMRAIEKFPDEPIVEYSYPENRYTILAYRAANLLDPVIWRVGAVQKKRTWLQRLFNWD